VPFAVRQRQWRSLLWVPTWFAYAFLRRLGTLEAAITLPVRPLPVAARARSLLRARAGLSARARRKRAGASATERLITPE
jgi:hypothetical protein